MGSLPFPILCIGHPDSSNLLKLEYFKPCHFKLFNMVVREDKQSWKSNYFTKIIQLLDEYPKCFVVDADNVGSKQMQQIRISLRGHAIVLMGKNTMMRKAIRGHLQTNPDLECLLPHIRGNVGFVFTKEDLVSVRDMLLANKVKAPAKAGALAPLDVAVPAQNTGLGPEKTSFFQALNIPTKITTGTIEITNNVALIKAGDKVGMSESTLLTMLGISPFTYGLVVNKVYDSGSIFDPTILDITDEDLKAHILGGIRNIAALCLKIGYPTVASVPHSIINGMKNCMALAAVTDITFKEAETMKAYLADPSAFAVAAPAETVVEAVEEKEAEKEESEDDSMDGGMFDMFG